MRALPFTIGFLGFMYLDTHTSLFPRSEVRHFPGSDMLVEREVERQPGSSPIFFFFFSDTSLPCSLASLFLREGPGKAFLCSVGWHGPNAWNYQATSANPSGGFEVGQGAVSSLQVRAHRNPERKKSLPLSSQFLPLYFAPTAAPHPHPRGCVMLLCDSQAPSPTLPPDSQPRHWEDPSSSLSSSPPWRFVLLSMFLSALLLSFSWQHLCPTLGSWSPSGLLSWVINFSSFGCPHAFQKLLSSLLKRTLTPTQHVKWTHTPLKPGNWPRSPPVSFLVTVAELVVSTGWLLLIPLTIRPCKLTSAQMTSFESVLIIGAILISLSNQFLRQTFSFKKKKVVYLAVLDLSCDVQNLWCLL